MPRIRVGIAPYWSVIFFACAIVNFYVYGITHDGMQAGLGVLMGIIGLVYALGPVLVIEGHAVEQKNPFGMTLRTHVFASPHDLAIEGRKLWVQTSERRVKIGGTLANAKDWRALADAIAAAQAKTKPPR